MGGLWFSIPALINGFPFVFPDSVDYLVFTPHIYRSPFYGLFIFFFHLDRFIWAPVFVQALIACHLLWVYVRIYAGEPKLRWFAILVLALGLFSSLPFFTGFIMPDFFTSVMILVFYLLGFHANALGKAERTYFVLLACVAISSHISNLPQAIALVLLVLLLRICLGTPLRSSLRQGAILVVPLALATSATLLNNLLIHRVFALFPAAQTFVLANMIEQGPARHYLQEVCPDARFKLCANWNTLPATSYEFLWSTDNLQRLGGFEGMHDEADGDRRRHHPDSPHRGAEHDGPQHRFVLSGACAGRGAISLVERPLDDRCAREEIRARNASLLQDEPCGARFDPAGIPARP